MIAALIGFVPSIVGWYRAKQEAQMRFYEIAWEATKAITKFIVKHIRIICKLVIVAAILIYILVLRGQVSDSKAAEIKAITALNAHLSADKLAEKKRAEENRLKAEQGAALVKAMTKLHESEQQKIFLASEANLKKERGKHAAAESFNKRAIDNYRERVRLDTINYLAVEAAARLPGNEPDRSAGSDSEPAALRREIEKLKAYNDTLNEGGALCASDYNLCKSYVDSEQLRLGVDK